MTRGVVRPGSCEAYVRLYLYVAPYHPRDRVRVRVRAEVTRRVGRGPLWPADVRAHVEEDVGARRIRAHDEKEE